MSPTMRQYGATIFFLLLPSVAWSQPATPGSAPSALSGSKLAPPKVELTQADITKLLAVIPEVAAVGAKYRDETGGIGKMGPGMAAGPNMMGAALGQKPEALEEIHRLLTRHGFNLPDFAQKMAALVSTYLALEPGAFEKNLPSESNPEIRRMLADPGLSPENKQALRAQIEVAQKNKELLRAQLTQLASPSNRKVVQPYLGQIKAVLEAAQKTVSKTPAAAKGPRRGPRAN